MFGKKCSRCNRKIQKDFDFCPYCGTNLGKERDSRDYGFLGKDDFLGLDNMNIQLPGGFDKLLNGLMKQLDSQMRGLDKEIKGNKLPVNGKGISISISTSTGKPPQIKVNGVPQEKIGKEITIKNKINSDKIKEASKLPREEAKTEVRRFSNKIAYEISLPGIKKLEEIIVNKLENSIEIKAFSSNKVYFKLIPLNLPLTDYKLENEKLILEFKTK